MTKEEYIGSTLEDVCKLDDPPLDKSRRDKLLDFVKLTINGDMPEAYLAFNANLRNKESGIVIYILTNAKLLRIEVDSKEMQSSSFLLDTISNVERKLLDSGRLEVKVSFQSESFGLRYDSDDKKISDFFQKLDQLRNK